MTTVTIIGAGRAGGAFALALNSSGYRIDRITFREAATAAAKRVSRTTGARLERTDDVKTFDSDITIIATPDQAVGATTGSISERLPHDSVLYHASGALSSAILRPAAELGVSTGSIHPLCSLSSPEDGAAAMRGAYFCIEGSPNAVRLAETIVRSIGGSPLKIDTANKALYHAAAVMASGNVVALFDMAMAVMTQAVGSAETAKSILMPLFESTAANLRQQSNSDALTGPFARGEADIIDIHLAALNNNSVNDAIAAVYIELGLRSLELAAASGRNLASINEIRAKLLVAKQALRC